MTKREIVCKPAIPKFHKGEMITYEDNHFRRQVGMVKEIEAKWPQWSEDDEPLITYTVEHPSYKNRVAYILENNKIAPAPSTLFGDKK